MDEREEFEPKRPRGATGGVRIIGAEEAAAALEAGEAEGRRPMDAPRFGDVPRTPAGPRPAHRFPLPDSVDPAAAVRRPPVSPTEGPRAVPSPGWSIVPDPSEAAPDAATGEPEPAPQGLGEQAHALGLDEQARSRSLPRDLEAGWPERPASAPPEMQHWSEPPTGEVPQVLLGDEEVEEPEDDIDAWASLPSRRVAWREGEADWDDVGYEPSVLADEQTRVGALDDTEGPRADPYSFDLLDDPPAESVEPPYTEEPFDLELPPPPVSRRRQRRRDRERQGRGRKSAHQDAPDGGDEVGPPVGDRPGGSRRSLPRAVATGAAFGIVAVILFKFGPVTSLLLAVVLVTAAAAECYAAFRRAGYRPATLLGITASVAIMVAAYLKGEAAIPLVMALLVVFTLLWYLAGVTRSRPTVNMATTIGGFAWVGLLGSFTGLLLDPNAFPNRHGVAFLVGAVVATIAHDVGAYAFGQLGSHRLAPQISPNKTWEGLIGGGVAAVVVSIAIMGQVHPWTLGSAAALGIVVAVMAPLGDLCESMIKRDLGVKDMSSLLPGHGGVLDRIDALIFVVPATYYLVRALHLG